jgi:hypothetical protein
MQKHIKKLNTTNMTYKGCHHDNMIENYDNNYPKTLQYNKFAVKRGLDTMNLQ